MTTRWHWQNTAPAVSPAFSAAWAVTSSALRMAEGAGNGVGVTAGETSAVPINVLGVQVVTDALAAGELAGTFRLCVSSSNAQSSNAFLRVRVRLVDSTGAEKAVLLDATDATALPLGGTQTVTAFSGALTPATAVAGDRLVVEYGAFMNNTATTSRSIGWGTWNSGGVDFAFVDGTTGSGKPWFEIEFPPNVPTALTQTGATTTTVDVGWTAPAAGSAPTGYDLRVDGGAPTALGLVTSHTVTGLTASTAYDVEVRSTNTHGNSAWVSVIATTDDPPAPDVPTALTQTGATLTTVDVGWTAPAAGSAPTGYDLRVDGGAPTALGLVTSHTITGLVPSTSYLVEVRSTNSEGVSDWVDVTAETVAIDGGPGYDAHLRVGSHEWDVSNGDPASYGPIASLTYRWIARQDDGWPTQHEPTQLVFGVIVEEGTDFDDVDQGTVVHFTFTPEGYEDPLVEFGGTVRDLVARPHDKGMVYSITAVDHLQALDGYTTAITADNGDPSTVLWEQLVQDADGAGMGIGTRPYLPDPLDGDQPIGYGFLGGDVLLEDVNTWKLMRGLAAGFTQLGPDFDPIGHRVVFTYRLDVDGNLDTAAPYEGTWVGHEVARTSAVDGCLVPTAGTEWTRERIEPNVVHDTNLGTTWERPHDGVDVVREQDSSAGLLGGWTDPVWILAGEEVADQWSTAFILLARSDPAAVYQWFTLPTAMGTLVEVTDIDPRHTPTGSGEMVGMLGQAALLLGAGGDWRVGFRLRRALPPAEE